VQRLRTSMLARHCREATNGLLYSFVKREPFDRPRLLGYTKECAGSAFPPLVFPPWAENRPDAR
jgi:hypothetical protein